MPGFNRTGPLGRGPMTGRGRGLCRSNRPVDVDPVPVAGTYYGRGLGLRRGFNGGARFARGAFAGRGLGPGRMAGDADPVQPAQSEINALKAQTGSMQQTLDDIAQRLSQMEKSE